MKSNRSKTLPTYVLCDECHQTFVKRVYEEFAYKPLCGDCLTSVNVRKARRAFNADGSGYVSIVQGVVA